VNWKQTMRKASARSALLAACGLLMLGGCSSPTPTLYTISVVPGQVMAGGPAVVNIHDITIPRYLERPQIVRFESGNQLDVRANDWWGEPIAAMLSRVLAEELAQRLPHSIVLGENGAINATADAPVQVDIDRLVASGPAAATLVAHSSVSFAKSNAPPVLRSLRVETPTKDAGTTAYVAAISVAVGQLADSIAVTLQTGGMP